MEYKLVYWLHNQSKLFSSPQCFVTNNKEDFVRAIKEAVKHGYEIEYATGYTKIKFV